MKLEAESKLDVKDIAYYINRNGYPVKTVIEGLKSNTSFNTGKPYTEFIYTVREFSNTATTAEYFEHRLFKTKEELLENFQSRLNALT